MEAETSLIKAVAAVDAVGGEIDHLKSEIDRVLRNGDATRGLAFGDDLRTTTPEPYISRHGWVAEGWRWTFPVARVTDGQKAPLGSLSIQVDIGGHGRPARDLYVPCLLVAYAPGESSWDEVLDCVAGPFWPVNEGGYALLSERLFIERMPDGSPEGPCLAKARWFFVVPLFAVGDADSLRDLVVAPVANLLADAAHGDALDGMTEAFRFEWRDGHPVRITDR